MTSREDLLDSLVGELEPARPAKNPLLLASCWTLLSAVYVVVFTHLLGPLRPTVLEQLQSHPRFLIEMLLGGFTVVVVGILAFRAAVPGAWSASFRRFALILGGMWLAVITLGLAAPALEPSMLGKRDHCYLETLAAALPPMLFALYWQHRLYCLSAMRSALLAGLAAGLLPALYMQLACMYVPAHILLYHIGPGVSVALLALLFLRVCQRCAVWSD